MIHCEEGRLENNELCTHGGSRIRIIKVSIP